MDDLEKLRQEIKTWAKDNLVGKKVYREELKDFIEFTWQGLKHDIGNNRKMQKERLELLKSMENLLQNADYQGIENDYHQRPDIKGYHYFSQKLENMPLLRMVIREMSDKKIFYDHLFEIKNEA